MQKVSIILTAFGVTAWFPYLYFVVIKQQNPSLFPYLGVHLTGVVGGAIIRKNLKNSSVGSPKKRSSLSIMSIALITVGVAVWTPYLYMKYIQGHNPGLLPYLPVHLTGVIGGGVLMIVNWNIKKD